MGSSNESDDAAPNLALLAFQPISSDDDEQTLEARGFESWHQAAQEKVVEHVACAFVVVNDQEKATSLVLRQLENEGPMDEHLSEIGHQCRCQRRRYVLAKIVAKPRIAAPSQGR